MNYIFVSTFPCLLLCEHQSFVPVCLAIVRLRFPSALDPFRRRTMLLRNFFTEAPYAAALCNEFLLERCSGCFEAATDQWPCQCGKVTYCSETCMKSDLPWHECEYIAFRRNQRPRNASSELEIRLLGRLMRRYQVDQGMAVLTSSAFPSHLVRVWNTPFLLGSLLLGEP